jgi:hypothetical protein
VLPVTVTDTALSSVAGSEPLLPELCNAIATPPTAKGSTAIIVNTEEIFLRNMSLPLIVPKRERCTSDFEPRGGTLPHMGIDTLVLPLQNNR